MFTCSINLRFFLLFLLLSRFGSHFVHFDIREEAKKEDGMKVSVKRPSIEQTLLLSCYSIHWSPWCCDASTSLVESQHDITDEAFLMNHLTLRFACISPKYNNVYKSHNSSSCWLSSSHLKWLSKQKFSISFPKKARFKKYLQQHNVINVYMFQFSSDSSRKWRNFLCNSTVKIFLFCVKIEPRHENIRLTFSASRRSFLLCFCWNYAREWERRQESDDLVRSSTHLVTWNWLYDKLEETLSFLVQTADFNL